ncbi:MAG TPA: glycosyltransferase family 39 protein [Thermoanaerobaculia bacterium]|nr:glycosyltransferase family 39 protein [Thermoanaerobaculia bacterium]
MRHKILLLLALFAVKLVVAVQFDRHPLLQPDTGLDTSAYVELAQRVSAGDVALGPGLYYVAPLYIYFLAIAHTVTAARVLQVLLGTIAVALIFLTAREWFGKRAAWISAVLAGLTGVFTYYEALILQSSLDVFLTALALWLVAKQRWLLAGCAFGIASLNRPNMLVAAVAVVIVVAAMRQLRAAAIVFAGLLLGLAPVTIRNLAVAHQWSLVSSHGGINFYIGNGEGATGFFHAVPGMPSTIEGLARDAHRVAEGAAQRTLTDAEVSTYYSGLAWQWIRAHPAAWLRLMLWKTYAFLNTAHISTPFSYTFYAYDAGTLLLVLFVGPWLLVPLGILGLARRRQLPLIVFAAAYAASVILFFITERYKLPFFVAMAIGAGAGVEAMRRRVADVAIVVALLIAVNWPLHLDDGRTEERLRMAEFEASRGNVAEAQRWAGDVESPRVEYLLGRAYLAAGQPSEALPHLRSAIAQRVNVPLAGYDLVVALQQTGDRDGAVRVLRALKPPPNSPVVVFLQLARKAAELDAPDVAEPFLRRAVKVAPDNRAARQMLDITLLALGKTTSASAPAAPNASSAPASRSVPPPRPR